MNQTITHRYENETSTHYYRISVPGRTEDVFIHAANPFEAVSLAIGTGPGFITTDEAKTAKVSRADEPVGV